jgi:adenylosuccinate lyase
MTSPTSPYDTYTSPLASRNASEEMLRLWSPRHKFNTWRKIWLAVAEAQHEMTTKGAPSASSGTRASDTPRELVTREQVEELRAVVNRPGGITDDEMRAAEKYERELRHDVMAHVHALGDSCPKAKGIIHLGMTSQDVVCNADLIVLEEAGQLLMNKMVRVMMSLTDAARRSLEVPTLGFTHYQPAQPTTVGRRCANWASDLHNAYVHFYVTHYEYVPYRGLRGATGTQASFLSLFDGEGSRVDRLEELFFQHLWGHEPSSTKTYDLTGQTYPRVIDTFILADLASTASVLHKIATDIRLLCNRKEIDEPFEDKQIGSSAMPYKRNPMRCERICGLTRFVMNLVGNAYDTAATQWLERTLDDSSNRRLSLPEAFLALDGALDLMHNVASGLIVHEAMVRKNLMAELPFMATENILMACVKLGGDRQHYHELIRQHAQAAGMRVKQEGLDNDLLDRLQADKNFWSTSRGGPLAAELDWNGVMDPMKYVGRSVEQTERFISEVIEPLRETYGGAIAKLGQSGPKV